MFWKKTKSTSPSCINSDEYTELTKKIVSIVSSIDILSNRFTIVDEIVKSNRAKISKLTRDKILDDTEKDISDNPRYI